MILFVVFHLTDKLITGCLFCHSTVACYMSWTAEECSFYNNVLLNILFMYCLLAVMNSLHYCVLCIYLILYNVVSMSVLWLSQTAVLAVVFLGHVVECCHIRTIGVIVL